MDENKNICWLGKCEKCKYSSDYSTGYFGVYWLCKGKYMREVNTVVVQ